MVVFSTEFGSEDPVREALQAARWMAERDPLQYCPHIGIASGTVAVGYVGTPLGYDCSVFGSPVTMASRCAGISPPEEAHARACVSFPAELWGDRDFDEVFPPTTVQVGDEVEERPHTWKLQEPRDVYLKGLGDTAVRQVLNTSVIIPAYSLEEDMERLVEELRAASGTPDAGSEGAG